MNDKRFTIMEVSILDAMPSIDVICDKGIELPTSTTCDLLNELDTKCSRLEEENERLKKFMNSREHIRLSINIETGELQRHIYATGQWFGDFDRVLCEDWINEDDYQKFVDRVIEVYNTEFKGDVE